MTRRLRTVTKIFKNMYLSGWTAVQFQFQFQSGTLSRRPPHAASSSSPPYHAVFISRFLPAASLPSCSRRAARAAAAAAAAASSSLQPNHLFQTASRFPPCFRSHLENGKSTFQSTLLTFLSMRSAKGVISRFTKRNYGNAIREIIWGETRGNECNKRKAGKRRRTGNRRPLRFARISRRLDTLDRAAAGELQQLQVPTYNCIGRGRRVVVQFTIQDDLNDPGPRQPGAKCRQTVVAGSARCIFMILFFFSDQPSRERGSEFCWAQRVTAR